jgi:hypothetical protein
MSNQAVSPTHFTAGYLYTSGPTLLYGSDQTTVTTNKQPDTVKSITWICKSVSKAEVKFVSATGTVRRFSIYTDAVGDFIYPRGKFEQCQVLRSSSRGARAVTSSTKSPLS